MLFWRKSNSDMNLWSKKYNRKTKILHKLQKRCTLHHFNSMFTAQHNLLMPESHWAGDRDPLFAVWYLLRNYKIPQWTISYFGTLNTIFHLSPSNCIQFLIRHIKSNKCTGLFMYVLVHNAFRKIQCNAIQCNALLYNVKSLRSFDFI